jgi:hypothetical protein
MYTNADLKSAVVRDLDPSMMLYPTGDKIGVWWKVTDELGNVGWVVSTNFQLARSRSASNVPRGDSSGSLRPQDF